VTIVTIPLALGIIEDMKWQYPSWITPVLPVLLCAFGSASSLQAQTNINVPNPVDPVAQQRTLLTGSFAQEKLWQWQKRLNLHDWKISVIVARSTDLKPKTLGNVHWDLEKKTAVIRVLDPADYHMPLQAMLEDVENTVVHELIHLEMAPVLSDLQRNEANRRQEEYAVNHMVDALLKLDRGR
jgi:hypothetical protein